MDEGGWDYGRCEREGEEVEIVDREVEYLGILRQEREESINCFV